MWSKIEKNGKKITLRLPFWHLVNFTQNTLTTTRIYLTTHSVESYLNISTPDNITLRKNVPIVLKNISFTLFFAK